MTLRELRNPKARPTGQKVWAGSQPPETAEDFVQPLGKAGRAHHLEHLDHYSRRLPKLKGEAWGEITPKHRAVYRAILELGRRHNGRMTPAYREIALVAGCVASTVRRAIEVLVSHGFLEYRRRWRIGAGRNPRGVAVEQDTNCYRVLVPKVAVDLVNNFRFGLDLSRVPTRLRRRIRKASAMVQATRAWLDHALEEHLEGRWSAYYPFGVP